MNEQLSRELIKVLQQTNDTEYTEAFERAFEITKIYAGSNGAQASAIPMLFEKMFELFAIGRGQI